ncbi:MAG: hypothetical protein ACTHKX_07585 [Pseudolysinimonas sp.]
MTSATTPAPRRSSLQWADLVAGLVLTGISGLLALVMLAQLAQLAGLGVICDGVAPDGARCSPAFLTGTIIGGYAIVIFAWALGLGLLIVRAVRRRTVFWVPLASVAVIIAAFYLVAR